MAVAGSFAVAADGRGSRALNQLTPHDRLYSVAFSGDFGEAVGDGGLVLETTDGGKTWARDKNPPTNLSLLSVAIAGSRSIAVGQQGLILIRDQGKPWRKIEPVTDRRLLRVSLNKNGLAVAAGAFGTLLKSTDGGETWADLKPDWAALYQTGVTGAFEAIRDEPTIYAANVFDDGAIVIGGEFGPAESLDRWRRDLGTGVPGAGGGAGVRFRRRSSACIFATTASAMRPVRRA